MKLVVLYKHPTDSAAFDKAYFETHLPLIEKLPGLKKTEITRFTRSLGGDAYYLMAEMDFADEAALKTAMKSQEMAAAGANLDSFAKGMYSLMFGEELAADERG